MEHQSAVHQRKYSVFAQMFHSGQAGQPNAADSRGLEPQASVHQRKCPAFAQVIHSGQLNAADSCVNATGPHIWLSPVVFQLHQWNNVESHSNLEMYSFSEYKNTFHSAASAVHTAA